MNVQRPHFLMIFHVLIVLFLSIGLTSTTLALSPEDQSMLKAEKSKGSVGEQLNGYLGIVIAAPSNKISTLVTKVNAERKALYKSLADRNSLKLKEVENLAGKKAIKKTKAGQSIQLANGKWSKK